MTTALDTNVLLDLLEQASPRKLAVAEALETAANEGRLIISEVVYAELAPSFPEQALLDKVLGNLGVDVVPLGRTASHAAGRTFAAYRRAGGKRHHILADFLIGAHAAHHAQRLVTRDRGFYRKYYPELPMMSLEA